MYQLQDAINDSLITEKLAGFSTAQLQREIELRGQLLKGYDEHMYENKDVIAYDEFTGEPYLTEER